MIPERDIDQHPLPAIQGLSSVLPYQPPRRRRPILAVLDLLQKRYSQQSTQLGSPGEVATKVGLQPEGSDTPRRPLSSKPSSESMDDTKVGLQQCVEESYLKPTDAVSEENKPTTSESGVNQESSKNTSEKDTTKKAIPLTKKYSLLDSLMIDHPDINDGFSYAFKYSNTPSKLDDVEVSVQQSIKQFPEIPEEPLQHRIFKNPVDYQKAQNKLDALLGESIKTGGVMHLNTPGAFGPLLLSQYFEKTSEEKKESAGSEAVVVEVPEGRRANNQKPTKLMLRPVAKAVAGPRGIAVASPIAKAVLRRGQTVELDYDPDAVAIAGPGGRAHAHPEFLVDYQDSKESEK